MISFRGDNAEARTYKLLNRLLFCPNDQVICVLKKRKLFNQNFLHLLVLHRTAIISQFQITYDLQVAEVRCLVLCTSWCLR